MRLFAPFLAVLLAALAAPRAFAQSDAHHRSARVLGSARKVVRAVAEGRAHAHRREEVRRSDRLLDKLTRRAAPRAAGALPQGRSRSPIPARPTPPSRRSRRVLGDYPGACPSRTTISPCCTRKRRSTGSRATSSRPRSAPRPTTSSRTKTWATSMRAWPRLNYEKAIARDARNKTAPAKLKLVREVLVRRRRQPLLRHRIAPAVPPLTPIPFTRPQEASRCCNRILVGCRRARAAPRRVALAANPQVELDTTAGVIKIELYPDAAPKTVANFLDYVKSGHYAGTQFHRVIDGFMVQGGGFTTDFKQKPTKPPIPHRIRVVEQGGTVRTCRARSRWRAPATPIPRRRSSSSTSPTTQRLNFAPGPTPATRVRQGRRRHGRRQQDREGAEGRGGSGAARHQPRRRSVDASRHQVAPKSSAADPHLRRTIMVVLKTNHGDIKLELDAENAPATVANFLQYVRDGHYDNTVFHRVIDGFMIQGGGMEPGHEAEAHARAGRQRGHQRPQEQEVHGRDGAHVRAALGDGAILHQRRRQRLPRLQGARAPTAGAIACSARWWTARTWSTASARCRRPTAASTRTCRRKTS